MASTTLVNTAEAAELRLVHFLGDHDATSPFVQSCENAIHQSDIASLLNTVCAHKPAIEKMLHSPEGVGAFTLLAALLDRLQDGTGGTTSSSSTTNQARDAMKRLVTAIEEIPVGGSAAAAAGVVDKEDSSPALALVENKIAMLCALYNLRAGSEKCWILTRIFYVAAFSGHDESVLNLLPERKRTLGQLLQGDNLESLMMGFELEETDKRELYGMASSVVAKLAQVCRALNMEKEAAAAQANKQRFLLKMLGTYSTISQVDDQARMAAKESALGAIRDPVTLFSEQRTILSLPPIATLQDKDIYTLLEIFQQGKLEDFQSFLKTHPQTLSKNNLSEQDAIRHMRLLSLCSLATEHEEIPYDAIATTLQVDQSEVENWVIDAVSSGLLSAKMDQLQHVVMVERCVVRRFGMEQWKVLQKRLDVWKKNVKSVLEGLKQSQHSQD